MSNPYETLPPEAFWRVAVGEKPMLEIGPLWTPKFAIGKQAPIATLGSCFAQHISRAMVANGYTWLNAEPAPPRLPHELKQRFQYDIFSARVGNIYTVASLRQWVRWAFDLATPSREVWEEDGRFYDPFRPSVEPNGFASEEELFATRARTIAALRTMFETCGVFIFTLGLTEGWLNESDGAIYPMCPGTVAGQFVPGLHVFKNYQYPEIRADLSDVVSTIREHNPDVKMIFTVSPVPLVATASGNHVLPAVVYSKSTLRAVAGDIASADAAVDYFPSYEMISAFPFRGAFFEPNLRGVTRDGVDFVMGSFFEQLGGPSRRKPANGKDVSSAIPGERVIAEVSAESGDLVCDEMILDEMRK